MKKCWAENSEERPNFTQLKLNIEQLDPQLAGPDYAIIE